MTIFLDRAHVTSKHVAKFDFRAVAYGPRSALGKERTRGKI